MVWSDPCRARRGAAECGACRSPGTTSSATACGPSSSTAAPPAPRPRCSTSGCRTPGPTAPGWPSTCGAAPRRPRTCCSRWSLRGAPHAYRRSEAAQVAAAVAPWSEADAAKRIFDASRPLRAAGIPVLEALDVIASQMRDIVTTPTAKGDLSRELTARLDAPYLRFCRVCDATHTYEQPFRLALLRAGLELEPGTSPPVLRRIPGWRGPAARVPEHLDPVRAVLHLLGPATPRHVAAYVDAPVREVGARWPEDVTTVEVDGEERSMLTGDVDALTGGADVEGWAAGTVRPLPAGPGPGDRGAGRGGPQGPVAHARPPRSAARRTRGGRHLAAPVVREEAAPPGGGVVRGGAPGPARTRRPNAWPPSGARRSTATCPRPARGSAPCPGRRRRTW